MVIMLMMIMMLIKCDHGDNANDNDNGDSGDCRKGDEEYSNTNNEDDVDNNEVFPLANHHLLVRWKLR